MSKRSKLVWMLCFAAAGLGIWRGVTIAAPVILLGTQDQCETPLEVMITCDQALVGAAPYLELSLARNSRNRDIEASETPTIHIVKRRQYYLISQAYQPPLEAGFFRRAHIKVHTRNGKLKLSKDMRRAITRQDLDLPYTDIVSITQPAYEETDSSET